MRRPLRASTLAFVCLALPLAAVALHAQTITDLGAGITAGSQPLSLTGGPDGNIWFTEHNGNRIGRITPAGDVTEFSAGISAGASLNGITAGPDGSLWFCEESQRKIGRITTAGVVTEFSAGVTGACRGITSGPDGNLWFTEPYDDRIGRIAPGATAPCVRNDTTACLLGNRFEVTVDYASAGSGSGAAHVMSFDGARTENDQSVFWWFFEPTNFEMGVKMLAGCPVNEQYWIFVSGLTDQGWTTRVRDTQTGAMRAYTNAIGHLSSTTGDTSALGCP